MIRAFRTLRAFVSLTPLALLAALCAGGVVSAAPAASPEASTVAGIAVPESMTVQGIPPISPEIAEALELLGNAQEAAHHLDDARRSYDDALAIRARHPDHPELAASAETGLAILLVDAGKPAAALPRLEHALALATANTDTESNDLADARIAVARALLALHRDRPRALSLLRDTRAALRPGIDTAIERKEIDRLLASAGDKP